MSRMEWRERERGKRKDARKEASAERMVERMGSRIGKGRRRRTYAQKNCCCFSPEMENMCMKVSFGVVDLSPFFATVFDKTRKSSRLTPTM
jgi:hypothetical protein